MEKLEPTPTLQATKAYWHIMKVLASAATLGLGFYYSCVQPGPMDFVSGIVNGLVIYAIWFARERVK